MQGVQSTRPTARFPGLEGVGLPALGHSHLMGAYTAELRDFPFTSTYGLITGGPWPLPSTPLLPLA